MESKESYFRELIGALNYVSTRANISYSVSHSSQLDTCYKKDCKETHTRVLKGYIAYEHFYSRKGNDVQGTDADSSYELKILHWIHLHFEQ